MYGIICTHCELKYIACTKRPLKKRIAEHVADIRHNCANVSGAACHFIDRHEMSLKFFKFYAIELVEKPNRGGNLIHKLHNREAFWILMLQSRHPTGLNYRSEFLYIY